MGMIRRGRSVLALQRDPLAFFEARARQGEPARFRLGPYRFHLVTTPELADEVYLLHQHRLEKGLAMERARVLLGDGLLTSAEPLHLRQRRLLQPAFRHDALLPHAGAIVEEALTLRDRWRPGDTVDLAEEMARLAARAVVRCLFGADVSSAEIEELVAAVDRVVETFDAAMVALSPLLLRFPLPRTRRFLDARARLDALVGAVIRQRRAAASDQPSRDVVSLLLGAEQEDAERLVRDELVTLLLAGYETVAYGLTWTFYLLAKHPDVERRLHAELASALRGRAPGADDVDRLPYARRVIAESLRLYPPSWINSRRALEDFQLGGVRVRRGDNVVVVIYLVHRDPRHFPEPDRFDPDRFLPMHERDRHRCAFVPFGAGVRRCIGRDFAWLESMLVLTTLAQGWRPLCVSKDPAVPLAQFTLRPAGGMPMRLERRATL